MSRTIHVNDSFFGHDAGRIETDGTIKLPDGIWGHQTVGTSRRTVSTFRTDGAGGRSSTSRHRETCT